MRANHGQEIMENELRLVAGALAKRMFWSGGIGCLVSAVVWIIFAPKNLLLNVLFYLKSMLIIQFRELPILGVRAQDIKNLASANSSILHQAYFWQILALVFFTSSLLFLAIFSFIFWRRGKTEQIDNFMRGSQLIPAKIHNGFMRKKYGKKPPHEMGTPLFLGKENLVVPAALQYRHFAFVGTSGYGKSTAIEEVLSHARINKHKVLIVDIAGAFYSKFGRQTDRILSIRDVRSSAWDFWHEPLISADNIATALIEAEVGQNQYFWKSARQVLAALLRINSNLENLISDFAKPQKELKEKLKNGEELAIKIIGEGDGDQADGVLGTTVLDLAFVKDLHANNAGRKPFSITEWMNDPNDKSWVFLVVDEAGIEVSKPIIRTWFELACIAGLSRKPNDAAQTHTWLVIDEAKSVGQLPSLPAILDKGRKYKVSVVLGFQAFSHMKRIYGEHDATSIFQGLQNQFFFRMSDPESAEYASNVLGEQDIEQASYGISFGSSDTSDRGSVNHSRTRRKVVLPSELQSQDILHSYAKFCHHQPVKVTFSTTTKSPINEAFIQIIGAQKENHAKEKLADESFGYFLEKNKE